MFSYLPTITLIVLFILTPALGQESNDTTAVEEGSGREMFTSVDVSYSQDKGNTDLLSLYYGLNFTLIGDVGPLKDTEFLFDFYRSDDQFDGEPYTDDQSLTLKFDVWANQRFSPFLFFQKSFDNIIGLDDRVNFGLGGKAEVFGPLSVSYAMLWETEDYLNSTTMDYDSSLVNWYDYTDSLWWGQYNYSDSMLVDTNYYYWDVQHGNDYYLYTDSILVNADYYYTDSVLVGQEWQYTDSTEFATGGKSEPFFRHSIRPKFKIKLLDDNLVFDYRFYYKPKVDDWNDYLLEHELKISFETFHEALSLDFSYTDKYNARYDLLTNGGRKIFNPETGILFKEKDQSFVVGFSFMF